MEIVLVLLIAFVVGMEGILDEFQFHQPILSCSLIGLATGHLYEGVLLGGILQLIALGWVNVGAAVAPDAALAGIISSIFMVKGLNSGIDSKYVVTIAMLIAIPLSALGTSLTNVVRKFTVSLVHKMDENAKSGNPFMVSFYHLFGLALQGFRIMIPALLLLLIPESAINSLLNLFDEKLLEGLYIGSKMACAVGFAMVMNVLYNKEIIPFLLIGFALSSVSELSLIALAMISFAIALFFTRNSKKNNQISDDPLGDILDDYD